MLPIRPPSKALLDAMEQLHSMPPSGMTVEQARAQVALHREEAMQEMKRDPMGNIKHRTLQAKFSRVRNP